MRPKGSSAEQEQREAQELQVGLAAQASKAKPTPGFLRSLLKASRLFKLLAVPEPMAERAAPGVMAVRVEQEPRGRKKARTIAMAAMVALAGLVGLAGRVARVARVGRVSPSEPFTSCKTLKFRSRPGKAGTVELAVPAESAESAARVAPALPLGIPAGCSVTKAIKVAAAARAGREEEAVTAELVARVAPVALA